MVEPFSLPLLLSDTPGGGGGAETGVAVAVVVDRAAMVENGAGGMRGSAAVRKMRCGMGGGGGGGGCGQSCGMRGVGQSKQLYSRAPLFTNESGTVGNPAHGVARALPAMMSRAGEKGGLARRRAPSQEATVGPRETGSLKAPSLHSG